MKGILITNEMVKAIAENRKTQTRRLIKPHFAKFKVGQIVYIKEAWRIGGWDDENGRVYIEYRDDISPANPKSVLGTDDILTKYWIPNACWPEEQWRNPCLMPAWAARRFIKILDVRSERLLDITFEDCLAEGIVGTREWEEMSKGGSYKPPEPLNPCDLSNEAADKEIDRGWRAFAQQAYFRLWDKLNPQYPSASGPWCWRIEFERADRENRERT